MRNALLITAALFCLTTSALAGEGKNNSQPQPKQAEQVQMASNKAEGSMSKSDCMPKAGKQSKKRNKPRGDWEGDTQASQNQVEYGGAG